MSAFPRTGPSSPSHRPVRPAPLGASSRAHGIPASALALALFVGACASPREPREGLGDVDAHEPVAESLLAPLPEGERVEVEGLSGTLTRYADVRSNHVRPRTVDIWLPPGVQAGDDALLNVLVMHDGQNLFDPASSFIGVDWGVDEALATLGRRDTLVVAVWNTPLRMVEYLPAGAWNTRPAASREAASYRVAVEPTGPLSEAYLRFLCDELLPLVRLHFPVHADPEHTFVSGSSMGGLISLEVLRRRPDAFGGAACLSPSWQVLDESLPAWIVGLGAPAGRRLWLDRGTTGGEEGLAPFQETLVDQLRASGWTDAHLATTVGEGHDHSERAWRQRLPEALAYLLGPTAR